MGNTGKIEESSLPILVYETISDAARKWRAPNRQSRGSTFPSDHMEVLTFFHGALFEAFCMVIDEDREDFWVKLNVPFPDDECYCYSCRTDALLEAITLHGAGDADEQRHRFRLGAKHIVIWEGDSVKEIYPEGRGSTVNTSTYIKQVRESHEDNLRTISRSVSTGGYYVETRQYNQG
jgi:hypothetical protein